MTENRSKFLNIHFAENRSGRWLIYLVSIFFITGYWLPRNWSFYGANDWDLTYAVFESARKSFMEFGQFPQFNPWMAFGSDLNANPQSGHMSIFFIPIILFGTFYGYKLSVLLAMFIGLTGCYQWFLELNKSKLHAVFISIIFISATYFCGHIFTAGHSNVLYLYTFPWLAFAMLRMRESHRGYYAVLAILILAHMIAGGAPIVFMICSAFLLLWAVAELWIYRNSGFLFIAFWILCCSVIVTLWKLLPAIELWSYSPRLVTDDSGIHPVQWLQSLGGMPFRTGTWHAHYEYHLGLPIMLLGLLWYFRKELDHIKKWAILALLITWFCLGNFIPYANPWYWLNHYIPPFTSIRAPSRFGIVLLFALLTALAWVLRKEKEYSLPSVLLLFAAFTQLLSFRAMASFQSDTPQFTPEYFSANPPKNLQKPVWSPASTESVFLSIRNNEFRPRVYEPLNLPVVSDTPTAFISYGSITRFSPNSIEIYSESDTTQLGIRYSENWKLYGPGEIKNRNGLLLLTGIKGHRRLAYNNHLLSTGMIGSAAVIPVFFFGYFLTRKRKKNAGKIPAHS